VNFTQSERSKHNLKLLRVYRDKRCGHQTVIFLRTEINESHLKLAFSIICGTYTRLLLLFVLYDNRRR